MSLFRKEYRALSAAERETVEQIKDAAERLENLITGAVYLSGANSRYIAHAIIRLEESVMWAVKGIT